MEQMYLIEIFVDKVTVFAKADDDTNTNKKLITKIKFGPHVQFIIKEGQLAVVDDKKDDNIETDENGRQKWTRIIRVGKSYLFPSYPDTMLMILSKFPLEIELWNDDENEPEHKLFIGVGNMHWDPNFFHMLKETAQACKIHEPLSIKSKTALWAECCCTQAAEIDFILRLSALGESIITEFQQLLKDPDSFVFRTNKAPSMFQCKRVEGDDPNFCMVGSLYETTTLEDPDIINMAQNKIEVCTELQSCGFAHKEGLSVCDQPEDGSKKKKYPIEKIRMGDIIGPCGNPNCALAHKVRKYIRSLESYKGKGSAITEMKPESSRKVCGACSCKDDRWHRDECPEEPQQKVKCMGCEGMAKAGHTCKEKQDKLYGTGMTPKESETQVTYVLSVTKFPDYRRGMFGQKSIVENCFVTKFNNLVDTDKVSTSASKTISQVPSDGCFCQSSSKAIDSKAMMFNIGFNNPMVYNVESHNPGSSIKRSSNQSSVGTSNPMTYNVGTSVGASDIKRNKIQVYNCSNIPEEKDCRCSPIKSAPPCRTFDCECLTEAENEACRKTHRPYCPLYRHKENCPVTMMNEEEEQKKLEDEEDEVAPLPYGLPPIQLGPCPILGRPCTVPDGFARMYRNAQLPTQPYSYSDAGKVCCSKEYERIKKAIKAYMKNDKGSDFRCVNKFNVDTERRCCDKEQILMSLMGKSCCGSHKISMNEKYAQEKKQP